MALDPSISLGFRPPVIPPSQILNPVEQFGQILSLRNLMTQGQLGQLGLQTKQLEVDQLRRQMQEQQEYADAMKAYAQGASTPSPPVQTAPLQTAPVVPPVTAAVPPMTAPYTPVAGASPAPLSALMTPQTPAAAAPAAPIAQAPAMAASAGNPRLLGMTAPAFIARFPISGMAKVKEAFALDEAEAKAAKEKHEAAMGVADELGRAGIAVRNSKDPATQFVTELTKLGNNKRLPWPTVRQMISDGYDAHKNDIQGFIDNAQNVKDTTEIAAKNLAAGLDERKQGATDIGPVINQDGYDKFLAIHPTLRPILGDTFSPDVKDAAQHLTTEGKDLPKARMDAVVAAAGILEPARAKGQAAFDAALTQFPKYIQDWYRDADTPLEVRQRALTPEQKTTAAQAAAGQTQQQTTATANIEGKLRDDFTQVTKDFRVMRDAYGRAQSIIAGGRGGVRDIGLIYQWMKMNDPGSSVREGERADAANAGGVTEGIRNLYNRLLTGEVLPDKTREDIVNQVQGYYTQEAAQHQKTVDQYTGIAVRSGLNPKNVIPDFTSTAGKPTGPEKPKYETIEKTGAAPGGRVTGTVTIAPPGKIKVTSPEGDDYWADASQWPTLEKRNFTRK
jgi:hypothetical protein